MDDTDRPQDVPEASGAGVEEDQPGESVEDPGDGGKRRDEMAGDMEEELLVLDPEHPLMKGFQSALKTHLDKQLERLENELRELRSMEQAEGDGRVALGTALFKVQEELGRVDLTLTGQNQANSSASSLRQEAQARLEAARREYRSSVAGNSELRAQVSQTQREVDDTALRLLYLRGATGDMSSDLATTQTCARKAQLEKNRAAQEKNVQDLYADRLSQKLERLQEETALYDAQASAQAMETQVAQEGLSEAQLELDALLVEQKQLLQQWNSSLLGVGRRDEAYNTMQEALRAARDQARALDTELEGSRRSVTQQEEQNEQLTLALNAARLDCGTSRKLIARSKAQEEALLAQHAVYARALQESEDRLEQVTRDCATRRGEAVALRAQMDREVTVRRGLEQRIMGKMQEQLSHGQAAKYSRQQVEKIATQKKERELQVALLEDDLAQVTLAGTEVKLRVESLSRVWAELQKETAHQQELLDHSETEISKQDIIIERKEHAICSYKKKIHEMCTKHEDVGGLEIRVNKLCKEVEELEEEIQAQQHSWLRQQEELVRLNRDRQAQSAALLALQERLTVLQQKKVHTEGEIQQERREQAEVERHMNGLMLDIAKLNGLLGKNSQQSDALEHSNSLTESEFISRLKDAERESIDLQMNLERIQEERDMLLNSLLEAEQQVLLWEKKTHLVKETQLAVREEMGQGDIRFLKSEIHRMEVRYEQLMKQQARLLRELDAAVARREAIEMHSETQAQFSRSRPVQSESRSVLQGLRRKIQDCQKKSKECDGVIAELQDTQRALLSALSQKQKQLGGLRSNSDSLDTDLRSLQDTKEKAVRDGRYRSVCVGGAGPGSSSQRLSAQLQGVASAVQRVCQDHPEHQGALHRLGLAFAARRELLEPPAHS
ncbi:hypothetical protein COCON_G00125450 [Conger conger]|uniref:Coiled-coil domain-containing protein 40 n=1 Tax=Conger conger TaxID=82655 RepID=A0A9Q1DCS2_CONCO|nr:hypothetical protein COCON_G00125450 [Conger conger]